MQDWDADSVDAGSVSRAESKQFTISELVLNASVLFRKSWALVDGLRFILTECMDDLTSLQSEELWESEEWLGELSLYGFVCRRTC